MVCASVSDAVQHSEANLPQLAVREVDVLIADNDMRKRAERLSTEVRHQEKPDPGEIQIHRSPAAVDRGGSFSPVVAGHV